MGKPQKKKESSIKVDSSSGSIMNVIKDRQTEELVIALCGPLGSGISYVVKMIAEILKRYNYEEINIVKVSDLIKGLSGKEEEINKMPVAQKINELQNTGNDLRKKYGNDILSQLIVREIAVARYTPEDVDVESDTQVAPPQAPISRRHATLIDSLKHPEEVELLKVVYGNSFYLIGVLCPEEIRKNRLTVNKGVPVGDVYRLMDRDKSESKGFGQKLLNTLQKADFFIRNDKNLDDTKPCIDRYIRLILNEQYLTPTIHEYAMYAAQSAALRSSCLSRQVGAAIVHKNGNLISTGCNDVPKAGGGLYSCNEDNPGAYDGRCFKTFDGSCTKTKIQEEIYSKIKTILKDKITEEELRGQIFSGISNIDRLKNLLEFSRSVHAEMDAIISAARQGGMSLQGASLYCTTFPCHNCARHIIAAGIKTVYYIEPYEKSLARELHGEEIVFEPGSSRDESEIVIFTPFEGVAPKQYINLFAADERKEKGKKRDLNLSEGKPSIAQYLDSYFDYETKVVEHLEKHLQS